MIESILWVLFIVGCVVVSSVILLQEGKGGGLGEAFGGAGAQTFGVRAEGINKFTAYVTVGVVVLAIVITQIRSGDSGAAAGLPNESDLGPLPGTSAPAQPGDAGGAGDAGDAGDAGGGGAAGDAGGAGDTPSGDGR